MKLVPRLFNHFFRIIELIYTGSISLIFRGCLSLYVMIVVFILVMFFITWYMFDALIHFFKPLKVKPKGV